MSFSTIKTSAHKADMINRYESKYLVPRARVAEIRDFIQPFTRPDPHAAGSPPEYTITTLQLDTPDLAFHHAKEREIDTRVKLRVRTYGDIGTTPVFAEIKAKYGVTIAKQRAQIPFHAWNAELALTPILPRIFRNEKQEIHFLNFRRILWELGARPAILIRYIRESHIGVFDHYVRITFDRALEYQPTDSWTDFGRGGLWRGMDTGEAQGGEGSSLILEIKTLHQTPVWVMDLVERFQLKKSGQCKYSTAWWQEGLFRGTPEPRETTQEFLGWAY